MTSDLYTPLTIWFVKCESLQILWKSGCDNLVNFPSHLKIWIVDYFTIFTDEKTPQKQHSISDQFCPNGFFKNSDSISRVYQEFWIQIGGNSISDQFCPNGCFKNFDIISISRILDPKWGKLNFRPILSKWVFQKLL